MNTDKEQMEDALALILKHCIHTNQDAIFKAFSKMSEQELAWISQAIYIHLIEPNPEIKLN